MGVSFKSVACAFCAEKYSKKGVKRKSEGSVMQTRLQNNYLSRHKFYDVLNVITEVTARKIKCSATEVLISNRNHWAK